MSTTHRTVLFCSVMMAALALGCAPGVESSGAPAAASKQQIVSELDEEHGGDPGPDQAECVQGAFEGGATCVDLGGYDKDPIAGVQKEATVACAALGLMLSEMSVSAVECAEGSGKVSYVCCPVPPPGPASDSCHDDKVGADSCVDLATLEAAASARCAESGHVLASVSPLAGCPDDQASTAMISCCPASP